MGGKRSGVSRKLEGGGGMSGEMRFVPNPDYPPDWEQKERDRLGDCFKCTYYSGMRQCGKTGMPLVLPIHGCCGRDPRT